ncbi:MAG: GTP cyclohydrolase I, partial [Nitrospirae bacterium]|nr:GTP cyclohydrolase I [Nitrospirota bacterium]
MDKKKIEKGIQLIIEGIGEDPERPGLKGTPSRVAEMYEDVFSGIITPTNTLLKPISGIKHDEMVLIKNIHFFSMCEHHLLPFFGRANIAYIPSDGKIVG